MRTMFGTAVTIAVNPGFVLTPKPFSWNPNQAQLEFLKNDARDFLYGIPYHSYVSNTGPWLGIPRGEGVYDELRKMIKLLEDKRSDPKG